MPLYAMCYMYYFCCLSVFFSDFLTKYDLLLDGYLIRRKMANLLNYCSLIILELREKIWNEQEQSISEIWNEQLRTIKNKAFQIFWTAGGIVCYNSLVPWVWFSLLGSVLYSFSAGSIICYNSLVPCSIGGSAAGSAFLYWVQFYIPSQVGINVFSAHSPCIFQIFKFPQRLPKKSYGLHMSHFSRIKRGFFLGTETGFLCTFHLGWKVPAKLSRKSSGGYHETLPPTVDL